MSHRITTQTKITNKKLALQAVKTAGWRYTESGGTLRIQSGPMNGASVNTTTGEVTGDTDYHRSNALQSLNKFYSEALVRAETAMQGGQILERTVAKNQDIVLIAQYG